MCRPESNIRDQIECNMLDRVRQPARLLGWWYSAEVECFVLAGSTDHNETPETFAEALEISTTCMKEWLEWRKKQRN